ncbi:MAG: response regulator transcription factor [Solirubrobacteraceae bacterium]
MKGSVSPSHETVPAWIRMIRLNCVHTGETGPLLGRPSPGGESDVSVLVVDDQPSYRAVMRDVVQATPGLRLVGEAASGEDAVGALGQLAAQLVIMDKRMPGMSGLDACRAITERDPEVIVVLCSVEDPDPATAEAHGAAAMIRKQDLSRDRLLEIVRARLG